MLKHQAGFTPPVGLVPAAFRRLCVETIIRRKMSLHPNPAAFRRLCVETLICVIMSLSTPQPPSGGCVLKPRLGQPHMHKRQPAAFGRLCVETLPPYLMSE